MRETLATYAQDAIEKRVFLKIFITNYAKSDFRCLASSKGVRVRPVHLKPLFKIIKILKIRYLVQYPSIHRIETLVL